ncbi:hypothetical protein K432DRAFT_389312 [Lepidopterella palustris CBS 459.81]|uniref:Uncharacterized protein n=1 Tax=Lepidopterella palustris CBS 459.81 TaxID=1314670 RepID=A0A8E2JJV6_9PEZI|nr:hypothetical protein K432DRAFT_389312 [Lepidopterella palustris CBS 459.81]
MTDLAQDAVAINSHDPLPPSFSLNAPPRGSYVTLYPPHLASFPAASPPSAISWPEETRYRWYLSHSTRTCWKLARNVQMRFRDPPDPRSDTKNVSSVIQWSWQALGDDGLEEKIAEAQEGGESSWKVLGAGKEGALENWMIETEYGIEDSAGEIRADWRPLWLVLYFPGAALASGIDIYLDRTRYDESSGHQYVVAEETIKQIKDELDKMEYPGLRDLSKDIYEVKIDGCRIDVQSLETQEEEGIWRAEDEPQPRERLRDKCGCCVVS